MAATLEKAFDSLRALPTDMQEEIAEQLIAYAARWEILKAGIDQGTRELDRGEGVEITDREAFLNDLESRHGRS